MQTNGADKKYVVKVHNYPQTKLREGNVFTPVCDSVHGEKGGNVFTPVCDSVHGGVLSIQGGICSGGVCVQRGSLSRGLCPEPGLCPAGRGVSVQGVSVQGVCHGDALHTVEERAVRILLE